MNHLIQTIKGRQSIRKFKAEPIAAETLAEIIEAGRYAPSGHNVQLTHFVVIENQAVLDALRQTVRDAFAAMEQPADTHHPLSTSIRLSKKGSYNFMYNPAVLVIAANARGNGNAMADTTLALGNMMLMAQEKGIGSCWINQLRWLCDDESVMKKLETLGISRDEIVCGSLALGYPDQPLRKEVVIQNNRVDYIK